MMEILEYINRLFVAKAAYAGSLSETLRGAATNLEGSEMKDADDFVDKIIQIAIPLAVGCAVILVVYGGYMLISSQGNPDKLQEARGVITNAIIGLLVILLSVGILLLISNSLGLDIYT